MKLPDPMRNRLLSEGLHAMRRALALAGALLDVALLDAPLARSLQKQ